MKTILQLRTFFVAMPSLIVVSLLSANAVHAQQWTGSGTTAGTINRAGDVALFPNTISRLTLGNGASAMTFAAGYLGFNWARNGSAGSEWTFNGDGANNGASAIWMDAVGNLCFSTKPSTGGSSSASSDNFVKNAVYMRVKNDGKVVIGNPAQDYNVTTPGTYKLYVEGGILTERVRVAVKTTTDWQDQVFDDSYQLRPLDEVRTYIRENHHLPEIPSAADVVKSGVDLQEMDSKLLQKVEELTLYVLKQQEEINALKKELRPASGKGRR